MTYQESLREAFHAQNIRRVAIVDDGYDAPAAERLAAADVRRFEGALRRAMDDDEEEDGRGFLDTGGSAPERELAADLADAGLPLHDLIHDWRTPERLKGLWNTYGSIEERPARRLLHALFQTFAVDRADKVADLERLEELVRDVTGEAPTKFDGSTNPMELIEFDLIFLDFYLEEARGPSQPASGTAAGRERSFAFLSQLVQASPQRMPLVMLISSEASADDIPEFRKHANVLASAMQFLPKGKVLEDVRRAQAILLGLVARRKEVDALWGLLGFWKSTVQGASEEMMGVVRELDLADYSYLQRYRLTNEKMPLAHYLVWLFNGYLASLVETKLSGLTAAKLINSLAAAPTFPSRVAPTAAISTLYGGITVSTLPMAMEGFQPKTWAGDVFVRADRWHAIAGSAGEPPKETGDEETMPEVLAVVTPACDLVPGRSDKLRAVTTIGGTLVPLGSATQPTTHFIELADQQFHVAWNPKWPMTIPIGSFGDDGPFSGRYRWVARLRELYHADLQQMLVRDVGRVGLPVAPAMPCWAALRVLLRKGAEYVEIMAATSAQRAAWILSSNIKDERILHLREDLAWDIRAKAQIELERPGYKAPDKLRAKLDEPAFIERLQGPLTLNKKAVHDAQELDLCLRENASVTSDDGAGCARALLIVFGGDGAAAATAPGPGCSGSDGASSTSTPLATGM